MLRVIPSSVHGVIDYITGATLLAAPYLFRFADTAAKWYLRSSAWQSSARAKIEQEFKDPEEGRS